MTAYVIVGGGVAGIACIEAIRSLDRDGEITLVGDDPNGYYSRPGLAYFLTGELPEKMLFPFSADDYQRLNIRWYKGRATNVNTARRQVILDGKYSLGYDRLLLALGAQAAPIKTPGDTLEGVVKLDHLDDARDMIRKARRARTAVVMGGGITALELAEGLSAQRTTVHYLLRGDRYWQNVLDEKESRIVERRLRDEGVTLHFHTQVSEILGRNGKVTGVRFEDGRELRCDLVAYAVGIRPRAELAREAGLAVERGILVNEYLQTSCDGVYAAGDVAQVFDPLSGKSVLDSLWQPARLQGQAAGLNMAGQATPYIKRIAFNVTRLAGLVTTIIGAIGKGSDSDLAGIARGDSETWRSLADSFLAEESEDVNRLRLAIGENTILGAIIMGDQTLSRPLQKMVLQQVDITPVRERLVQPDAALANLLIEYYAQVKGAYASSQ